MKKIFTIIAFVSLSLFGYSQSVVLYDSTGNVLLSNSIYDINITPSQSLTTEILFSNNSLSTKRFKVLRTLWNIDALDQTQFCWDSSCYGVTTNLSPLATTVPSHDTIDFNHGGFHAVFIAGTECVTRLVHYKFFDINNSNDSTGITLRYLCALGVNEISSPVGSVSSLSPNPVSSSSFIKYKLEANTQKGKLVFYDVLGKIVKQITLSDKEGVEKISNNDFNPGIYFYSFIVDDKVISTKKLVITDK